MGCSQSLFRRPGEGQARKTGRLDAGDDDDRGTGGSIILSRAARSTLVHARRDIRAADGSLELREGTTFTIGKLNPGQWRASAPVERPPDLDRTQHVYVPARNRQMIRLSYGYASKQGKPASSRSQKANQDSLVVVEGVGSIASRCLFGVFDGHGPAGDRASSFARQHLPDVLVRDRRFRTDPSGALEASFPKLHRTYLTAW